MKARSEFNPDNLAVNKGMLFTDFLGKWLNDKVTDIPAEEYSNFAYYVKSNIAPYFSAHNAKVTEITDQELIAYFETERLQNGTGNKALLSINRTICTALDYAVTIGWRSDNPAHDINPCLMSTTPYFTDFLLDWLKIMKLKVRPTTYASYEITIESRVIPYFKEKHPNLRLDAVTAKHIQDYYAYEMNVRKVSANTVKHRHANIHKALSYAYKTDLIQTNPADKVELPTIDKFVGHFYNAAQLEEMFKIFKGDPAEFGVIAASFYGLRRSEVLGLRWDAIDFEEKTITIRHTVNETRIDGKYTLVLADTTKTKSSYRTLPLVAPFEAILKRMKAEQEENRKLCGNCYCQDYLGYIYVNELGELIKPGYLSSHVPAVLKEHNMPPLDFMIFVTRMSSTRQKINLCKSRNPKLSRNSDSPEFLLLCTTSYSNLIDARRKIPVMIWYFPVAMLPTFFLTSLHLYEVCNNIVEHRVVKVFPREYTITYFC